MLVRPLIFILVLLVVYAAELPATAELAMVLFIVAATVTAVIQTLLLRKTMRPLKGVRPDFVNWRAWVATGGAMMPMLLVQENLRYILLASAAIALSDADLGRLALCISILGVAIYAVRAVDISIAHRLSNAINCKAVVQVRRYLSIGAAIRVAGILAAMAILLPFAEDVLGLFSPEYAEATRYLMILMAIPVAEAIAGPSQIVLNVSGRRKVVFLGTLAGLVLIVVGTALGAIILGLTGATIGSSAAYAAMRFYLWYLCWRETDIDTSVFGMRYLLATHGSGEPIRQSDEKSVP